MPSEPIATKGAVNANCYCTQTEAEDYLDNLYGADDWAQLDSDSKDRLILTAARQIDSYGTVYVSADPLQAMKYPLAQVDGYDAAKEANILQAFYLLQNSDTIAESRTGAIQSKTNESIGPMSMNTTGFNQIRALHGGALRLLAPYLDLVPRLFNGRLAPRLDR